MKKKREGNNGAESMQRKRSMGEASPKESRMRRCFGLLFAYMLFRSKFSPKLMP